MKERIAVGGLRSFARYSGVVLGYMIVVILWGAFVRHTDSGAGCGSHWPMCNGEVIPRPEHVSTIIEYSHRLSSGLSLLLTVGLLVFAHRAFAAGHPARPASRYAMLFVLISAALGALFVKMGWVEQDNSVGRAVSLAIHLANTLLLVGALALTTWFGSGKPPLTWRGQGFTSVALLAALGAALFVGVSGAVTSLGDTLYPVASTSEAFQNALSPTAHFLIKLRVLHPLIAVVCAVVILCAVMYAATVRPSRAGRIWATTTVVVLVVQMLAGLLAVALRAPTWMALTHLALGDLLFIALSLTSAAALGVGVERVSLAEKREAAEAALGST